MVKADTRVYPAALCALLTVSVPLVAADDCGDNALALRDDGDDDGDDCSSSSSRHGHSSTSTSTSTSTTSAHSGSATIDPLNDSEPSRVSKGGIAGIVLGLFFGLLLLLLLLLFLRRRRRQRRLRLEDGAAAALVGAGHERKGGGVLGALGSSGTRTTPRTYANIRPTSSNTLPTSEMSTVPLVAAAIVGRHERAGSGAPHNRSASISSLPNPHEAEAAADLDDIRNRDLPPTPDPLNLRDLGPHRASTAFSATTSSYPPSSFFDPVAELTRGSTSRTATSRTSTLHSEMASYQKQLEAHHEKEMQVRDDAGGSSLPLEPPPEYQERLLSGSTSDLGEISHGTETHGTT